MEWFFYKLLLCLPQITSFLKNMFNNILNFVEETFFIVTKTNSNLTLQTLHFYHLNSCTYFLQYQCIKIHTWVDWIYLLHCWCYRVYICFRIFIEHICRWCKSLSMGPSILEAWNKNNFCLVLCFLSTPSDKNFYCY